MYVMLVPTICQEFKLSQIEDNVKYSLIDVKIYFVRNKIMLHKTAKCEEIIQEVMI